MAGNRLLVVEDEILVARDLEQQLTALGYEVAGLAARGEEAIALTERLRPDLVLMDIRLQGDMDGIEAAAQLRQRFFVPVVYLTAHADDATVRRAQVTEPLGYILKPFEERELRTVIEMALYKHQADRKLRDSERRYSTTLSSIGDAVIATDAAGRVGFLNPVAETLTGWPLAEARGRLLSEVFPLLRESTRETIYALEPIEIGEGFVLVSRGGERPIESTAAPITQEGGEPAGAVIVFRDISDRRRAEEDQRRLEVRVQQVQKLESLGRLAGGIAHDFNNLLTAILGYSDLALMQLPPDSPAADNIEQAILSVRRAAELTGQMLAYAGKSRVVSRPHDLTALVRDMGHLLELSLPRGARLHLRLADGLPSVRADAGQLRQVIMNLIHNAADALGEVDGAVTIATRRAESASEASGFLSRELVAGAYVVLEVADTGHGIPVEDLSRIFDPFFTTRFPGRGLGLTGVMGIAHAHGGAVRVTSDPGRGAAFEVFFPASAEAPAQTEAPALKPAWRGQGCVLVVDDESAIRDPASRYLAATGFSVLTAADGSEAVTVFRENAERVVAVLLDLTMPGMGGVEAFHQIRKLVPGVPVLMSSGYAEAEACRPLLDSGEARFLAKPYRLEDLGQALRELLSGEGKP